MQTKTSDEAHEAFSKFYAVVLDHWAGAGRRVLWSPRQDAWLRNSDYSRYMSSNGRWLAEPGRTFDRPASPDEEDFNGAAALALSVTEQNGSWFCPRCHDSDPALHFIAPDVYGEPHIYCIQVPAYSVVESSGGQGKVKHWGSPFGCQSVKSHIDSNLGGGEKYIGPVAAYLYGEPLPAMDVIGREWCSRCQGAAYNVRTNAKAKAESESDWIKEQLKRDFRNLQRSLADYYGD